MQKISIRERPEFTARFPQELPNEIRIRLTGGEVVAADGSYPRGHRRNPISDAELDAKFDRMIAGRSARDRDTCETVRARAWSAWELPAIDELVLPLGSLHVHDESSTAAPGSPGQVPSHVG
jgi:2-methylcitrate dehydratase